MTNVKFKGPYQEYVVKRHDSLYSIAQKFGTTVSDISDTNMLTTTTIYPGQVLLIPVEKQCPEYPGQNVPMKEYITQPGDTIAIIAQKLGVTPMILGAFNDFAQLKLAENQMIRVPEEKKTYTVKEGESMTRVLSKTNMSAQKLLELNARDWLSAGKTIKIT